MFKWLKSLLASIDSKPVVQTRSQANRDSITEDEARFIAYCVKRDLPACPDCGAGQLLKGPEGCGSINCLCNHCHSEFNLYWICEDEVIGERNSDPQGCSTDRRRSIYGIA